MPPFLRGVRQFASPRMHMCSMCAHRTDHSGGEVLSSHVCVTSKHDVRLSLFFVDRIRCSRSQALYSAVPPFRPISHNILRFDQPMDTLQTSHSIQQSHSNFNVAIKRFACSRGLAVGLTNTSCCGVCGAASTASQEVREKVFSKRGVGLWQNFLHLAWRTGERNFLRQTNPGQFPVNARFAHHNPNINLALLTMTSLIPNKRSGAEPARPS